MRLFDQSQESLVRNHLTAGKKCTFIKMIRIVIIVIEIIKILIIVIKIIMIIVKQISNLYFPLLWKFTFRSQSVFPSESSPCIISISIIIIIIRIVIIIIIIRIISISIIISIFCIFSISIFCISIISTISAATALAPFHITLAEKGVWAFKQFFKDSFFRLFPALFISTHVNVEAVQFEDLGGGVLVGNETEDLEIAPVPFHCPDLISR